MRPSRAASDEQVLLTISVGGVITAHFQWGLLLFLLYPQISTDFPLLFLTKRLSVVTG